MMNLGLLENKKTSVQKPRILLRPDLNKRFKPSRLIFRLRESQSFYYSIEKLNQIFSNKPHFVSEARTLRQYDWMNNVIRQVLYTLCIDTAKIVINFNKTIVVPK